MENEVTDKEIEDIDASMAGGEPADDEKEEASEGTEVPLEEMDKEALIRKIGEFRDSSEKNYDLYVRSLAEIDNMKKRFVKEKQDLAKFSNESLIKQLLPVIDNLEKAVDHAKEERSLEALREGVALTLKEFKGALEKAGLEEVKAEGEPFDPNFHEAMYELEDNGTDPGSVVETLQKGYTLNNRLIRPAMVSVSKGEGIKSKNG